MQRHTVTRRLFISYSHYDADLLGELRVHLRPFERQGLFEPWFDGYLVPGDEFDSEVRQALAASDFIALLVTPRFLASDYCVDIEMEDAVARHQAGTARVVPIIAKPCAWKTTYLTKLLATPTDAVPITKWPNAEEAWDIVAHDIAKSAKVATPANPLRPTIRETAKQVPTGTVQKPRGVAFSIPKNVKPTDQQIDDFRHASFETIADSFESSIMALNEPISGRYRRLDANRFTATLYREGKKVGGCTVFTGSGHFGSRGIAYHGSDNGETNSMNEQLTVDVAEVGLCLKTMMGNFYGGAEPKPGLTPEEGAERLWTSFTERLRY
ncbi:toll/interleukin-1 receptor domain-containing protein [soil metagenome]